MTSTIMQERPPSLLHKNKWHKGLYGKWIAANALAELIGLGATAALAIVFAPRLEAGMALVSLAILTLALGS